MKNKQSSNNQVTSAEEFLSTHAILGTYEGECADANITNNNGLDITRPVWEHVFNSDDYKQAIKLGWYIGFLGHPDDPGCMDFRNACIVMTDGWIDDNGKVYGKFNLIDTPVGRVVQAFQKAGVVFGISVRGAGDILDNSVEPESFVFRGFDLVTFPAFPESIPTFTELAASTDLEKQKKYKILCSTVKKEIQNIDNEAILSAVQSNFAKQSDVYAEIENKKLSLNQIMDEPEETIIQAKLDAMTSLYLESVKANTRLTAENKKLKAKIAAVESSTSRKIRSIKRITSSQQLDLERELDNKEEEIAECKRSIKASTATVNKLERQLDSVKQLNLKYKQKVESSTKLIESKDSVISSLHQKLDETVNAATRTEGRSSNLDAVNKKLREDIKAAMSLLSEYQEAYANLYATALGIKGSSVPVTTTTTVSELRSILSSMNTANVTSKPDLIEDIEFIDEDEDTGIVSL